MATIIVLLILLVVVALAIRYVYIEGACGGGCSSCSVSGFCDSQNKFDELPKREQLKHIKKMKEMQKNPEIQKALKEALANQNKIN